jgi:hypothetical protein
MLVFCICLYYVIELGAENDVLLRVLEQKQDDVLSYNFLLIFYMYLEIPFLMWATNFPQCNLHWGCLSRDELKLLRVSCCLERRANIHAL